MAGARTFKLYDSKKKRSAGTIDFINCNFIPNYLLVDYLRGGLEMTADFFFDFSTANNIKGTKGSLHNLPPGKNPYLTCFNQIFDNLQQYTVGQQVNPPPSPQIQKKINFFLGWCLCLPRNTELPRQRIRR